jgi:hypothetical protein
MRSMGPIEALVRGDLDAVVREIGTGYAAGAMDALAAADPAWAAALGRAEREVGALYQMLCEADAALVQWKVAVAELTRLWRRVLDAPPDVLGDPDPLLARDVA